MGLFVLRWTRNCFLLFVPDAKITWDKVRKGISTYKVLSGFWSWYATERSLPDVLLRRDALCLFEIRQPQSQLGCFAGRLAHGQEAKAWPPIQQPSMLWAFWPTSALFHSSCETCSKQSCSFHLHVLRKVRTGFAYREARCRVRTDLYFLVEPALMCLWEPIFILQPQNSPLHPRSQTFGFGHPQFSTKAARRVTLGNYRSWKTSPCEFWVMPGCPREICPGFWKPSSQESAQLLASFFSSSMILYQFLNLPTSLDLLRLMLLDGFPHSLCLGELLLHPQATTPAPSVLSFLTAIRCYWAQVRSAT